MWVGVVFCALLVLGQDARAGEQESRVVKTASGPVRGYKDPDSGLYIFYSIPYATAPTGIHRFKAPLPAPVWFQPLEAVDKGIVCPQQDVLNMLTTKTMQEDCLITNIFVPDTDEPSLPVVVYVHGGGYQGGFGDSLKYKNLVKSKRIVLVNFNYRVSIHGFLCLGTEGAPGNAGMKDQVAMLRWVKRNIANFGGNPNEVTIAGYSGGASAVDLLMISKSTKSLFNRVIPESGANTAVWSIQVDPLETAKTHAKKLNFTNVDDIYALEKFYQTASYEELTSDIFFDRTDSTFVFSPCVERDTGVERFLDDTPVNILKVGAYNKVPILYGFANMEGLFRVHFGFTAFNFKEKMNKKFSDFLPADLQFDSEEQKEKVAKKVKEFYFGEKAISEETILEYIDYFTDVIFAYGHLRSLKLLVESGNDKVYLYEYSFVDEEAANKINSLHQTRFKVNGADHCAQTGAIADGLIMITEDDSVLSEDFRNMKAVMRELWLNFMTTGNPVPPAVTSLPVWAAAGADSSPHMSLNSTLQLRGPLLQSRAPLPAPVWFQTFEAVNKGIVCPQGSFMAEFSNNKRMQEDCLIANVYVPDTEETNLPVVVYVHGGAYQVGFGDLSTPKNLVKSKKIIAVTFNYRLSIHGFLCLGTEGAPGNAGMKDQVAMLRWVQKNIANFGGNPDDVTINGFSAGSSAVDLLMISPSTEGLFNKVIPESGANSAVWSVQINPLENARAHAKTLNFTNVDDVYALETFYQTAPFEILTSDVFMDRADSSFLFSPCVERETGVERFLDDAPVNILKQGRYNKVPMLYGFANMEGLFRVNFGFEIFNFKEKMNQKFSDFLPADLQFENTKQKEEMAKKVKEFYFGEKAISEETLLEYIDYFTDVIFAYPTLRSLRLQVEAGNDRIYLYEYSFVDEETAAMVPMMNKFKVNGADHCAQTAALMDGLSIFAEDESKLPKDFRKMKAVMRELWLNFITTSNPVPAGSSLPAWPAAGADGSPHMSLNRTLQLRGPLLQRRVRFWDDIYERHYLMPVPPRTPPLRQTHSEL